jgi:hypothetical protein
MQEAPVNQAWLAVAYGVVCDVACRQRLLTMDDVVARMPVEGAGDGRAWGVVMKKASQAGVVKRTDRVVNSRQGQNHGRPMRVWESGVFRG